MVTRTTMMPAGQNMSGTLMSAPSHGPSAAVLPYRREAEGPAIRAGVPWLEQVADRGRIPGRVIGRCGPAWGLRQAPR
jgi:hypothetical protein